MLAIVCERWPPSSNSDTEILVSSLTICTSYSRSLGRRVICDEHAEVVDESSVSHLATSAREIDTIVSILEPLRTIALELQKQFKQSLVQVITNLSEGIASLPDELLSPIFKYAVRAQEHLGAIQAVRLSHVSRRFRQIALEERNLWTTLRSNASKEEQETFHTRSGTFTDLHAYVHLAPDGEGINSDVFTKTFGAKISRWKTLSLTDCARGFEGQWKGTYSESVTIMHGILKACNGVQFPRLEELYILGRTADSSSEAIIWRILDVSEPTLFEVHKLHPSLLPHLCLSDDISSKAQSKRICTH